MAFFSQPFDIQNLSFLDGFLLHSPHLGHFLECDLPTPVPIKVFNKVMQGAIQLPEAVVEPSFVNFVDFNHLLEFELL